MYTCIQKNIQSLSRELLGPRLSRRGVDIVSKPCIWNPVRRLFRSKPGQPSKLRGTGGVATPPTSIPPHTDVTSTSGPPVSLVQRPVRTQTAVLNAER